MTTFKDLTGQRFGHCVAERLSGNKNGTNYKWLCQCDCGKEFETTGSSLLRGDTTSCGCYAKQLFIKNSKANSINGTKPCLINSAIRIDNTSGYKGVSYNKNEQKWVAYINFRGERISLGYFSDKNDAIYARQFAEKKYFDKYKK